MSLVFAVVLVVLALGQLPYALAFARALLRRPPPLPDDGACPRALVVLPLRGVDPSLRDCVTALTHQDYPRFDVRIVIDSAGDPAWSVVESVLGSGPVPHVRVEALRTRRPTCSLKCSSLLQGVSDLDPTYRFVAQLDADTVPHPTWLRELAGGFQDPSVGAVTGNRWYAPGMPGWGALVRYLWNAAAVPQMYAYGIAWGGSMAVRADLIESARLRDRWSRAYGEDTAVTSALRPLGLRVLFLPSLLMVDRGACTLRQVDEWVRRQLVSARLHHPAWPAVSAHGLVTSLALALVLLSGGGALLLGDRTGALVSLAAYVVYQACMVAGLLVMEVGVRRVTGRRREAAPRLSLGRGLECVAAIPLTQAVHARALVLSAFMKSVTWRGARYELLGGGIRLVGDVDASYE